MAPHRTALDAALPNETEPQGACKVAARWGFYSWIVGEAIPRSPANGSDRRKSSSAETTSRRRSPYETRTSPHRPDRSARPHRIVPFVASAGARENPIGRISSNEETAACRHPHPGGSRRIRSGLPFRGRHGHRGALVRSSGQRTRPTARGGLRRIRIQPRCLRRRRRPARCGVQSDTPAAR